MLTRRTGAFALALAALALPLPAAAQGPVAPPAPVLHAGEMPQASQVPGWSEAIESLRTLPDRMLARLTPAQRADPQMRQEVARLALEALTSTALESIGGDGDAPMFLPAIGMVLNVGQPNADTIYRSAVVSPGASYRLRGRAGTLNQAVLSQIIPGVRNRPHLRLSDLRRDRAGRFDVLLSAERPAGHRGDWWQLNPAANRLMVRMVSADWATELAPTLAIERTDRPTSRPRASAAALEARLRALPGQVDMIALLFVDHVGRLRHKGLINRVALVNVGDGALAGQTYYEGAYELADDEALIVETVLPTQCRYRSLILTNELYETTNWIDNHSSLNHAQARADSDGKLRIVISSKDPGVRNWLDTAGHPRGAIQGRWTDCDSQPVPDVRRVKLADLRAALPVDVAAVTPAQREAILRERRRAYLERPQW